MWKLHFYGELEEEIYMEQPESFVILWQENKVCKLDNYLYGLKYTPKKWHEKSDILMLLNEYKVNESDRIFARSYTSLW
jgi:hypothetical protein